MGGLSHALGGGGAMTRTPSANAAKHLARRIRAEAAQSGAPISHARSLEIVARQHGFRDWNAFCAGAGATWSPGDRVTGTYLSRAFSGSVVSVVEQRHGWVRLEIALDAAIDVVAFDAFSNMRRRIAGVVGPKGHSIERTSDGAPILQVDLD